MGSNGKLIIGKYHFVDFAVLSRKTDVFTCVKQPTTNVEQILGYLQLVVRHRNSKVFNKLFLVRKICA